ncbi:MAG TPA: hypothetical protein VEX68_04715 [Bryobacteraceae bacterium]|nr:hypothetical protein [Bryobacteraceae bacterium]
MASERQRLANRRNGSKGGPSTEAGKQRSRLNTLKHGLTSTTLVVLPEEHPHEYDEVLRGFRESFQPHDATEDALVLRLAQAHWRSLRSRRVETGILDITAATERALARKLVEDCPEHLSPHNAIAVGFMKNPEERWGAYLRYDGAISRDFFRTLDALARLQRARQRTSPDPKPLVAAAGSGAPLTRQFEPPTASEGGTKSNDAAELSDSGIRFVSQNSPNSSDQENHKELTRLESLDAGLLRSCRAAVVEVDCKLRGKTDLETSGKNGPSISRLYTQSFSSEVSPGDRFAKEDHVQIHLLDVQAEAMLSPDHISRANPDDEIYHCICGNMVLLAPRPSSKAKLLG